MEITTYMDARDQIKSGDIVFIRDKGNPVARIIRFMTFSHYSHVGIAFWANIAGKDRLMIVEAQGGAKRRILNLSYYKNCKLDIIAAPKPWKEIGGKAVEKLGQVKYGWMEAIYVGLREFLFKKFNIRIPRKEFSGQICSEYVAYVLDLELKNVSPQALWEELIKTDNVVRVEVR